MKETLDDWESSDNCVSDIQTTTPTATNYRFISENTQFLYYYTDLFKFIY